MRARTEHKQSQRACSSLTDYKSFVGLPCQKTAVLCLRPIVPSTQYLLPRDSVPQSRKQQVFRPWAQLTSRPPCSAAPTAGLVGKRGKKRQKDGGAVPKTPSIGRGYASQSRGEDCQAKEHGDTPSKNLGPSSGLPGVGGGCVDARGKTTDWVVAGCTVTAGIGAPKFAAGTGVMAALETERIASGLRFV